MPIPLPQGYIGSLCELKSLENDLLATGRIIKIDYDALEIAAENEDETLRLFQYRTPIKIFVLNDKLENRVLVGITFLSTKLFARFEEVKPLEDFERRGAFRVNCGADGRIYAILTGAEQQDFDRRIGAAAPEEQQALMDKLYTPVRVVDISLTGVRLVSPVPLRRGQRFCLDTTPLKTPMTFHIRVERVIRMPDDSEQYGCRFFDLADRQSDILCRDLFQLQRLEKNRRQNSAI